MDRLLSMHIVFRHVDNWGRVLLLPKPLLTLLHLNIDRLQLLYKMYLCMLGANI